MNAIAALKSSAQNRLEGFALTALFQGFQTFAAAALLMKLAHHDIAGGAALFVAVTSIWHGLLAPWLAPKFPILLAKSYEPLFFDPSLSFAEKLTRWPAQPAASRQLAASVLMLSLLAVAVVSGH